MTASRSPAAPATPPLTDPAIALLLECVRLHPDERRTADALRRIADWKLVHGLAEEHGLVPMLCRVLEQTRTSSLLPPVELAALKAALVRSTQRGLSLTGELLRVLREFEGQSVDVMPYKGPSLAAFLYDPPSLRQFGDLDILVRVEDVPKACVLLTRLGYTPTIELTRAGLKALVASQYQLAFEHDRHGVVLELQWKVAPRYFSLPFDSDDIWRRHTIVKIRGTPTMSLSPEDLLFILCIHGIRHIWQRLSWIRDVAQLIANCPEMDWHRVMRVSADQGGARILALGLFLASEWGGAPLPPHVREWMRRDRRVPVLSGEILDRINRLETHAPDLFAIGWFATRAREHWRDRVLYAVRLAVDLGPADLEALTGDWSIPLQYVLRPLRLSRKYGSALLQSRF